MSKCTSVRHWMGNRPILESSVCIWFILIRKHYSVFSGYTLKIRSMYSRWSHGLLIHVCTLVQVCPQHCNGPGSHSADGMLLRRYINQQAVCHSGDMLLRQYVAQQMACPSFSYRCILTTWNRKLNHCIDTLHSITCGSSLERQACWHWWDFMVCCFLRDVIYKTTPSCLHAVLTGHTRR